jgi:hypothetical protein
MAPRATGSASREAYDTMSRTHALPIFAAQSTYCVPRFRLSALNSVFAALLASVMRSVLRSVFPSLFNVKKIGVRRAQRAPQETETPKETFPPQAKRKGIRKNWMRHMSALDHKGWGAVAGAIILTRHRALSGRVDAAPGTAGVSPASHFRTRAAGKGGTPAACAFTPHPGRRGWPEQVRP